ncbi:MAG TPA: amino acid permease, partial [bacterium]|nr:amino acid permease [bacterium]
MAIYPMLVVTYLGQLFPALSDSSVGGAGWYAALVMIALSVWWNLRGTRTVGMASQLMAAALLLPFVVVVAIALSGHGPVSLFSSLPSQLRISSHEGGSVMPWLNGILLCLWNYMGWENASPVATEVESPQKTYPRAMFLTVVLVAGCYVIPVLCGIASGLPVSEWSTGSWVEVGRRLGGPYLAVAIAIGGALCGLGMFNALIGSYARLPLAMARDGILPKWLARKDPETGAPTRSILLAAVLYTACLGLGFRRLVQIDVLLYGAIVVLEFASLIVLRIKEPQLVRPFRSETERYGEYSKAGEYVYDHPFQWGSKRTGPDLHRVGGKYTNSWHYSHMMDPRAISPGSIMPAYPWLFENSLDISTTEKKISAMQIVGVPYEKGYEKVANNDLKAQATAVAGDLTQNGFPTTPDKEIVALIAYLQRLGTDIKVKQ